MKNKAFTVLDLLSCFLVIILVAVATIAVATIAVHTESHSVQPTIKYTTIKIDGCEYIMYARSLTHKGDCHNLIHKQLENK